MRHAVQHRELTEYCITLSDHQSFLRCFPRHGRSFCLDDAPIRQNSRAHPTSTSRIQRSRVKNTCPSAQNKKQQHLLCNLTNTSVSANCYGHDGRLISLISSKTSPRTHTEPTRRVHSAPNSFTDSTTQPQDSSQCLHQTRAVNRLSQAVRPNLRSTSQPARTPTSTIRPKCQLQLSKHMLTTRK